MSNFTNEFLKYYLTNPLIITILILGLISVIFYKQIVGWFGEHWTKKTLRKLPKAKYKIINNLFLSVNGLTHQIDHIVVSPYGIFSIETKQYNGYITGSKYDKNWVRHAGKNKYYYVNPIRQNYGHCKALAELLNIDESKIYNIVCIPSNVKLKIEHDGELVRYDTIVNKIKSYNEEIINNVSELYDKLLKSNVKDKKIKKSILQILKIILRKRILVNALNVADC
ncbi:MAG: NERD domain-containing protein [Bacilli bacterium]|nr:NERD domain-containing protein [Bacilli bacterium]